MSIMATNEFNIFQWNCRSLLRRRTDLGFLLQETDAHAALLCETHLDDRVRVSFPNYEIVSRDRNRRGGGVAVLINKKFKYQIINVSNNLRILCNRNHVEVIVVKIYISENITLTLISVYSPPRNS